MNALYRYSLLLTNSIDLKKYCTFSLFVEPYGKYFKLIFTKSEDYAPENAGDD
jgi:hypothetical protein